MLKTDIVRAIAIKGGISYLDAEDFVNIMFEAFVQALLREERIAIRNFGSFTIRHYGEYISQDPRTGTPVTAYAKRLPHFKAGRGLLDRINKR